MKCKLGIIFILLISKTGLRFAEALGVTPADFDFAHQTLNISKTWDYKSSKGGFAPTKIILLLGGFN